MEISNKIFHFYGYMDSNILSCPDRDFYIQTTSKSFHNILHSRK